MRAYFLSVTRSTFLVYLRQEQCPQTNSGCPCSLFFKKFSKINNTPKGMANTSAGALETEMSALGMRNSYNDDDISICAQD